MGADEGGIASRSWGEEPGAEGGRGGVCRDGDAARLSKDTTCRGRVSLGAAGSYHWQLASLEL